MKKFLGYTLYFIFDFANWAWGGYVLATLSAWFLTSLGIPVFSTAVGMGILLIWSFVAFKVDPDKTTPTLETLFRNEFTKVIHTGLMLGVGYVLHSYWI
jgi:hypothetical protein